MKLFFNAVVTIGLLTAAPLLAQTASSRSAEANDVPALAREFRGAWISSVNNGMWPSRAGLSVEQQKKEMIAYLDQAVALKLNCIVFQVRPAADALYKSDLEPWSEYLTGVQGKAPSPYYDPLEMWIDEAHKRGLELHAWFNPYRAKSGTRGNIAENHISRKLPDVVKKYGNYLWMDPGEPAAAKHTLAVLMDIVRRYDVDAIHTDDYYYPYQVKDRDTGKNLDFPDDPSWERYQKSGGKLSRGDWRRDNVNQLVEKIYSETHKIKPWVKVGYSPFGIWQPENPPGIKGMNQYETLFADPKLWLNKGWLDYVSPQLYWKIEGDQSFPKLLSWWVGENTMHRHIWPGMSDGHKLKNGGGSDVKEIVGQIEVTRKTPGATGDLHWNLNSLRNAALTKAIAEGPYAEPAIIPASTWLSDKAPTRPQVTATRNADGVITLTFAPATKEAPWLWAIQARYGDKWKLEVISGATKELPLVKQESLGEINKIAVSVIDRNSAQSVPLVLIVNGRTVKPAP